MKQYFSKEGRADYAPPILANGEMSLALDFMGTHAFQPDELDRADDRVLIAQDNKDQWNKRNYAGTHIWWSGRRYVSTIQRFLIPFGQLGAQIEGLADRPEEWNQTLDTEGARMLAECLYAGGEKLGVEAFVHHDMNLLCVRRRFELKETRPIRLTYRLAKKENVEEYPRYMQVSPAPDPLTGGWRIHYSVPGQWDYEGVILVFADRPLTRSWEKNVFSLSGDTARDLTLFVLLRDNIDEENYEEVAEEQARQALSLGYDGLYAAHAAQWAKFYAESQVKLADERLMDVYRAAQYDLKAWTTPWSIPVGLCDNCWEGKFFAYDEYFGYIGLLTGNHRELAVRVPRFRKAGLAQAVKRMSSKGINEARYVWETSETGEEAAIPGFWYEHIFHMANISVGAWEYFQYTQDREFLRETAWPVMRACAEFYLRHMVYRVEGGKTIIGRCTDWERLGSSVQNAYMTTCSVIRTLQVTAEAAQMLSLDPDFVREANDVAARLYEGLPHDGEKYVPHPDCTQKSIGVFGGLFPYRIQREDNPLQRAAIEDYQKYEGTYGNMYAVGSGVSSWFAAWKGVAYARMHEPERAFACLRQAASSQGCFGELFEINEEHAVYRPWFTTANGIFLATVHNMLLQSTPGSVDLLPGFAKEEGDVEFTLPAEGDLLVHARVQDGKLTELSFKKGENCTLTKVSVRLPAWLADAPMEVTL